MSDGGGGSLGSDAMDMDDIQARANNAALLSEGEVLLPRGTGRSAGRGKFVDVDLQVDLEEMSINSWSNEGHSDLSGWGKASAGDNDEI